MRSLALVWISLAGSRKVKVEDRLSVPHPSEMQHFPLYTPSASGKLEIIAAVTHTVSVGEFLWVWTHIKEWTGHQMGDHRLADLHQCCASCSHQHDGQSRDRTFLGITIVLRSIRSNGT